MLYIGHALPRGLCGAIQLYIAIHRYTLDSYTSLYSIQPMQAIPLWLRGHRKCYYSSRDPTCIRFYCGPRCATRMPRRCRTPLVLSSTLLRVSTQFGQCSLGERRRCGLASWPPRVQHHRRQARNSSPSPILYEESSWLASGVVARKLQVELLPARAGRPVADRIIHCLQASTRSARAPDGLKPLPVQVEALYADGGVSIRHPQALVVD